MQRAQFTGITAVPGKGELWRNREDPVRPACTLDPRQGPAIPVPVRRIVIVLLLLASHAGVLLLGLQEQAGTSAGTAAPPASQQAVAPERESYGVAELLRKAEARQKKEEDEYSDEAMAKRAAEVAAAMAKIPEGADLAAMVKAGTTGQEEVSAQTVAAFGLWIDRDAVAALRWFGTWDPGYATSDFDEELKRHLQAGGLAMVDHYLKEVPLSRACLFYEIDNMAADRGNDFAVEVAAGLSDPDDRLELLNTVFDETEELKGNLAKIRSLLPDPEANALVKQLEENDAYTGMAEELRSAGFPAETLARLDARHAAQEEAEREYAEREKDEDDEKEPPRDMAERIRVEVADWRPDRFIYSDTEFREMVPDFSQWCTELQEGRVQPQEVIARLQAAIPGSEALGDPLRLIVLEKTFDANPRQGLEWLRTAGGDWKASFNYLVGSAGLSMPPELLESVVRDAYAGEEVPTRLEDELVRTYTRWAQNDPEGCEKAMRKMPEGSLREKLAAALEGKDTGK